MDRTETAAPPAAPQPLISVLMATYNRAQYIRAALESILQQPYAPLEIIVVDDGSTDDTAAVVQAVGPGAGVTVRYVWQPNHGLPAAHNHGLRLARGEVIAFLDSDDLWPPARLPTQFACFRPQSLAHDAPAIVLGRVRQFAEPGATVDPQTLAAFNDHPIHYALGSSLFQHSVFAEIGSFDESLRYTADWDWFMRAREAQIPMAADARVTLLARIHSGNMTQDRAASNHFTLQMIRKHMLRQQPGRTPTPHGEG
jgi:glycosyltransferase involved in cell wall biosynthesis